MGPDNKKNKRGSQHQTLDKSDAADTVDIEGSLFKLKELIRNWLMSPT